MTSENIYRHILMDEQSITPKYLQIAYSILRAMENGHIGKDYVLPSINDLSFELSIARDTAERAYRQLKKQGVVGSIPGKGYFIANAEIQKLIRVFLLFNKLSAHKKIIYDAFAATLGENAAIDFYIYNNDFSLFRKLVRNRKEGYTHHVIIPHFLESAEHAADVINAIGEGELILMDKLIPGIHRNYGAVYENFEKDIFHALKEALPQLSRYHTLKLVFHPQSYFPEEIRFGFEKFCSEYAFNRCILDDISSVQIRQGEVYINLLEDDLITLLEKVRSSDLSLGQDIGIISYNETPWKRFILEGITTISTDFRAMGELAAKMILNHEQKQTEVPFALNLRHSL